MIRPAVAALLVLVLTACTPAARESDDPAPAAAFGPGGQAPAAFAQCRTCHTVERGRHLVGPSLTGVWGKPAASAPGYPYSSALKQARLTWDDATLDRFLAAPMQAVPGTKMTHAGLKGPAARGAVIAYLKGL